ncbi:hypothetical protein ACH5RR_036625 [Cinchona calisaya]|uniref:Uncharacterized protein n=1 Tax=Cinchona calisaya TaxID=153742 RepID=A0ABD2Y3R8_9GENT
MTTSSSSAIFLALKDGDDHQNPMKQQQHFGAGPSSSSGPTLTPQPPQQKKKRNQPGTPSKSRFRGNSTVSQDPNGNKQKTTKDQEVKRKVYLCPEPTCVHHDPSRALGDLTGIKKHYSRKHCEKNYRCEKCSKRYAVQSDWKAHTKTCGTREYKCDCGTLFSRRDSFVTHRAFCDALAQESARNNPPSLTDFGNHLFGSSSNNMTLGLSKIGTQMSTAGQDQNPLVPDMLSLGSIKTGHFDSVSGSSSMNSIFRPSQVVPSPALLLSETNQDYCQESHSQHELLANKPLLHGPMQFPDLQNSATTANSSSVASSSNIFKYLSFFPNSNTTNVSEIENNNAIANDTSNNISSSFLFSNLLNNNHQHNASGSSNEGSNLFFNNLFGEQLSSSSTSSLYSSSVQNHDLISPHLSATALLQKAAQLGSKTSNNSGTLLMKTFGSGSSSSTKSDHNPLNFAPFGSIFSDHHNNGSHMNDLMSSFTGSNSSFRGGLMNTYGGYPQDNEYGYNATRFSFHEPPLKRRSPSFSNMEQAAKFQQNLGISIGGPADGLTRDFLGVGPTGEHMRNMSGGFGQRDHHGMENTSSDSERNTASKSPSFGGEGNFH